MTPAAPLISVIIPAFNRERYLAEAIESVLAQNYAPLEIIVVDDGSTDGTAAVAQNFAAVTYVARPNGGIGAARNTGVRRARGALLAWLDSDDRWSLGKLAGQTAVLAAEPAVDMVFGQVEEFISPELPAEARGRLAPLRGPQSGPLCGAMLIRRLAFDRVGLFDETLRVGEFLDWYARARAGGLVERRRPAVVLQRRLHPANQVQTQRGHYADYARLLKAKLDRERRA